MCGEDGYMEVSKGLMAEEAGLGLLLEGKGVHSFSASNQIKQVEQICKYVEASGTRFLSVREMRKGEG